jgi:hypothetical protein
MKSGTVYLINEESTNNYKIGITTAKKVEDRIKQLQTGSSNKLVLVHKFESDFLNKLETTLHSMFSSKRKEGEWFEFTEKDVENYKDRIKITEDKFKFLSENNSYFKKIHNL